MRVYECCRRFVWCALVLLLLVCALPPAAHAVPVDKLPIGSAAVLDVAQVLKPEERAALEQTRAYLASVPTVPCTGCSYCTEGCPQQIPIPRIFRTRNNQILYDLPLEKAKGEYAFATGGRGKASDCVECRQCEDACPQHLEITRLLKECAAALE